MLKLYYGEALGRYGFGSGHPFGTDRLQAFWQETVKRGLHKKLHLVEPDDCSDDDLALFHHRPYIDRVRQLSINGQGFLDYGDTPAFKGVYEASISVVGSVLDGLDNILQGEHPRVFVPIAGLHHARRESAAGFCVFNDAGVLIESLRHQHGIRRIAYVDIDAHHGDGVFYAFEDDPELIFADLHEDGHYLYPGTGFAYETGKGAARGTKLNIPLAPGSDDQDFFKHWPQVEAFIRAAKPQIILLQAGADSIKGDPLSHLQFSPQAHAHAARSLCKIADDCCQGRIIAMGGGGYNRANIALTWNTVVEAMMD